MISTLKNFLNNYSTHTKCDFEDLEKEFIKINQLKLTPISNRLTLSSQNGEGASIDTVNKGVLTQETASLPENVNKNRYKNVLPYDYNRVPLMIGKKANENDITSTQSKIIAANITDRNSDYINANFVMGLFSDREYVATQGPLENTIGHFWSMVWQQRVRTIVMICNLVESGGKPKCERYWPSENEVLVISNDSTTSHTWMNSVELEKLSREQINKMFRIRLLGHTVIHENSLIQRKLRVNLATDFIDVSQFHVLDWPDGSKPTEPKNVIKLIRSVNEFTPNYPESLPEGDETSTRNLTSYFVVHCSAGVGRTGLFIALHLITNLVSFDKIDVTFNLFDVVVKLRRQRPCMLQTFQQYAFLYEVTALLFSVKVANITKELETFNPETFSHVKNVDEIVKIAEKRLAKLDLDLPNRLSEILIESTNVFIRMIDLNVTTEYRMAQIAAANIEDSKLWKIHGDLKENLTVLIRSLSELENLKRLIKRIIIYYNGEEQKGVLYRFENMGENEIEDWVLASRLTPEINLSNLYNGIYLSNGSHRQININQINQDIDYLYTLFNKTAND